MNKRKCLDCGKEIKYGKRRKICRDCQTLRTREGIFKYWRNKNE